MNDSFSVTDDDYEVACKLLARLRRNTTAINKVLHDARKIWPNAQLYLDGSHNLNLMKGDTHDSLGHHAEYDRILGSSKLYASGGDW